MAQADRKNKQIVAITILGGLVLGLFLLMGAFMGPPVDTGLPSSQPTVEETIISDRTSSASPEMSWITQGRLQMERMANELEEQRKLLEKARKDAERRAEAMRNEYDEQLLQQASKIEEMKQALEAAESTPSSPSNPNAPEQPVSGRQQLQNMKAEESAGTDFIQRKQPGNRSKKPTASTTTESTVAPRNNFGQVFTLASSDQDDAEKREVRTLSNYLPAGSYAPAVVLSGADAATNVSNRENPIPVLFRLTGPAISAAVGGRAPATVNLKGCTVQGSATGDLSSERVKVRLITMTCLNKSGKILETKVAGYMTGSGKEGVRGHVTSREGSLTRSAMMAGLVSGLGSGFNAAAQGQIFSDNSSTEELLQGAAVGAVGGGIESAATSLSEYYIDRAEQYQPVVSLYGGTKVELVFLEGVELGQ